MSRPAGLFFAALGFLVLPAAAFVFTHRLTDAYFRQNAVPYPTDRFAMLTALAAACWMIALAALVRKLAIKRRTP